MLCVTVLGSGSRGNAILVSGSSGGVLVDAGFGTRTMAKRLAAAGRDVQEVSALLLTHEHQDHACGATEIATKWRWPVYASAGTFEAMANHDAGAPKRMHVIANDVETTVDGFTVSRVAVPHDARDCSALVITDVRSGARVGIALDVGHVPPALPKAFERLDLLVVESNHDEQMLANGPYPRMLKQRISGGLGHLKNGDVNRCGRPRSVNPRRAWRCMVPWRAARGDSCRSR